MSTPTVGWIGLGEMGRPMAAQLVQAGWSVVAFDLDPERLAGSVSDGAAAGADVADVVRRADVLVTMLRTGAQTEQLLLGADGIAAAADGRALDVIVMSTLDPVSMEQLAASAAERGLTVLDVPVSGGVRGAEQATLSVMASGPGEALERAMPMLDLLGARTYRLGDRAGLSQAAKLANQVMMAVAIAGTYEALALARDYGVDEQATIEAVCAGTGASWPLAHWEWMRSLWEDYVPNNALDILDKDLKAVMAATTTRDVETPVTAATFDRLTTLWDAARARATGTV
jgi:3-hydroxyisobutyrate dehydrogenase-like beta-hydroxyacid dehydrogenase